MTTSLSLWQERYAQLHFLLQLYDPPHQPLEGGSLEKWSPFLEEVVLYKKKLIFLVGVELGCTELVNFLKKHSDIQAILFESDLGKIRTWIETQEAEKLLQQPQVQIRYVMEPFTLEQALLEALQESPSAPFSLKVHSLYKKEVSEEVLESFLLRKAIRLSACLQETKYYHLLSRQLLANTQILLKSFYADDLRGKFQGVPAIVCGAGPSLKGAIPWLKQAENKALILAGGSTIAALTTQGVTPHLGLVFDPNPGEYARLKASSAPEMALLFGLRVLPEVLEAHQGPTGYMKTFSGGAMELALEETLQLDSPPLCEGLSKEGMSSTVVAVSAAYHMGCSPIILCGVDLAYVGGERYLEGVLQNLSPGIEKEGVLHKENRQGQQVLTTLPWVIEQEVIEDFAKHHPDARWIDCVEGGLGFPSLPRKKLQEVVEDELLWGVDLRNYLHSCLLGVPLFKAKAQEVKSFCRQLQESFGRLQEKVELILQLIAQEESVQDHPLFTLYVMEFEEELAFQYFLADLQEGENLSERWQRYHELVVYYVALFKGAWFF